MRNSYVVTRFTKRRKTSDHRELESIKKISKLGGDRT